MKQIWSKEEGDEESVISLITNASLCMGSLPQARKALATHTKKMQIVHLQSQHCLLCVSYI